MPGQQFKDCYSVCLNLVKFCSTWVWQDFVIATSKISSIIANMKNTPPCIVVSWWWHIFDLVDTCYFVLHCHHFCYLYILSIESINRLFTYSIDLSWCKINDGVIFFFRNRLTLNSPKLTKGIQIASQARFLFALQQFVILQT